MKTKRLAALALAAALAIFPGLPALAADPAAPDPVPADFSPALTVTPDGEIRSLTLTSTWSRLVVRAGDGFSIQAGAGVAPSLQQEVSGGALTCQDTFPLDDSYLSQPDPSGKYLIVVTLPADHKEFESAFISTGAFGGEISGLRAGELMLESGSQPLSADGLTVSKKLELLGGAGGGTLRDVSVLGSFRAVLGSGSFLFERLSAASAEIEGGSGNLDGRALAFSKGLRLKGGEGQVTLSGRINGVEAAGGAGKIRITGDIRENLAVDTAAGPVEIQAVGKLRDYEVDAATLGSATVKISGLPMIGAPYAVSPAGARYRLAVRARTGNVTVTLLEAPPAG